MSEVEQLKAEIERLNEQFADALRRWDSEKNLATRPKRKSLGCARC